MWGGGGAGSKEVSNGGLTKITSQLRSPDSLPRPHKCVRKHFPLISFQSASVIFLINIISDKIL